MKVLVLGACGYVGLPVAVAFVRNGHEVCGTTRASKKEKFLAVEEVIPLLGQSWEGALRNFNVVVDCTNGDFNCAKHNLEVVIKESSKRGRHHKITYIYLSSTLVHGDARQRGGTCADERSALGKAPPEFVSWRPQMEDLVLDSTDIDGIVIRPGIVYGRTMGLLGPIFEGVTKGKVQWPGKQGGKCMLIHQDDLADLILRAAEASPICKGLTIDACNSHSEFVDHILAALAKSARIGGWSYREPATPVEKALMTEAITHPSLARALLSWAPKKMSLADGMDMYWMAYKAHTAVNR